MPDKEPTVTVPGANPKEQWEHILKEARSKVWNVVIADWPDGLREREAYCQAMTGAVRVLAEAEATLKNAGVL